MRQTGYSSGGSYRDSHGHTTGYYSHGGGKTFGIFKRIFGR